MDSKLWLNTGMEVKLSRVDKACRLEGCTVSKRGEEKRYGDY